MDKKWTWPEIHEMVQQKLRMNPLEDLVMGQEHGCGSCFGWLPPPIVVC